MVSELTKIIRWNLTDAAMAVSGIGPAVIVERNRHGVDVFYCGFATAITRSGIEWERARFASSQAIIYKNLVWC